MSDDQDDDDTPDVLYAAYDVVFARTEFESGHITLDALLKTIYKLEDSLSAHGERFQDQVDLMAAIDNGIKTGEIRPSVKPSRN